jgi:hypothetical protein
MSIKECVRCSGVTRKGTRCKNMTCIYPEFCAVHTRALQDLVLKPSKIKDGGKGLFTTRDIAKNERISQYTGKIVTQKDYDKEPSYYGVAIPKGMILDAASTQSGIARYANDCRSKNKKAGECTGNNTKFSMHTRAGKTYVWLTATKKIPKGSEINIGYGRGYWP